ncbi:Rho-binding antiterminator [Shewanella sp. H8]|uniref:Rho-binding antiterminator n=1 Tax=Shewanella sp. H8 TaxID=3342676 RepID=UPI0033148DE6
MNPIKCTHYDYIELLCLYQYRVKLTLHSGDVFIGKFSATTLVNNNNQRYEAIVGVSDTQQPLIVILSDITRIDVLSDNAKFDHLILT